MPNQQSTVEPSHDRQPVRVTVVESELMTYLTVVH